MGSGPSRDKYVMKKVIVAPCTESVDAVFADLSDGHAASVRRKSEIKMKRSQSLSGKMLAVQSPSNRRNSEFRKAGSRQTGSQSSTPENTRGEENSARLNPQRCESPRSPPAKVSTMKRNISRAHSSSVLDTPGKLSRSNIIVSRAGSSIGGGIETSPKVPWIVKKMPLRAASNIDSFEFNNERVLGVGLMGTVRLAKCKNHSAPAYVAVKSIRKDYIARHNDERHVINEREILQMISSPFCVKLLGTFQDEEHVFFTMEYAAGGELFRRISRKDGFSPNAAKFYLCEVFLAVLHVQNLGFVYRDLKPENVMLDEYGHCKLIDFGFCTRPDAQGMCRTNVGTPAYLSPEQLNGKFTNGYTNIVDWWSLGVLLFELLTGKTPFCKKNSDSHYEIYLRVLKGKINFPRRFSNEAKILVNDLLQAEIGTRLTDPALIRRHSFFSDVDWGAVERKQIIPPFLPKLSADGEGDMRHFDDWGEFQDLPTKPKKGKKGIAFNVAFMEGF